MAGVSSCYTGIPLKQGKSENNRTYEVSYLVEHDGVKVYRFMDMGNYVYFTTKAIRRDFDGMHLWADCAKSVIDQYGYKRVGFVLANTLQEQSYDGRYHETNKKWSRTIFIPEDGGHRHTFLINSHPAVLDGFVSEYRAELAKLHLFGAEHCEPNSGEQDFTGRVLILSPDTLRESCWQPENQLWLALSGFGCQPHARGRSVLCTCLGDGETTRWNRSEFVGIIRDECIPDWAAEKLGDLRRGIHEMTM